MFNIVNDEMTCNVYGCEGLTHNQVLDIWKKWTKELVEIQREDGCEAYGDMVDCFWEYFKDGFTPQEAWDEEKSYAASDIE